MTATAADEAELLGQAKLGNQQALATLFTGYREHLHKMVRLRLDRRLSGRIDTSDVLQDAYLDMARRFPEYVAAPNVPFFIWRLGPARESLAHRTCRKSCLQSERPLAAWLGILVRGWHLGAECCSVPVRPALAGRPVAGLWRWFRRNQTR
jgi:DNA-directed RNA polymerase specialized sigma24 family protein